MLITLTTMAANAAELGKDTPESTWKQVLSTEEVRAWLLCQICYELRL